MATIDYKKDYLPGYTGHVPNKNEIFGCTAGDINKIITKNGYKPSNYDVDIAVGKPQFSQRNFYDKPPTQDHQNKELQYGNNSKGGENWIGGPTNNIKAQHIPGYKGYVPSIKCENLFGKSFANTTGHAINKEFEQGIGFTEKERFISQNKKEFGASNFRTLKDQIEPAELKDQVDASNFHDAEFQGIECSRKDAYVDLPTVGYQGFQSLYRKPTTGVQHRKDPFFNVNPLRPRLKDRDVRATSQFQNLSNGMKTAMTSTKGREDQGLPDNTEVRLPVVGYTGHRVAYKSQNFYGKNFRDCSVQSRIVQRMAL